MFRENMRLKDRVRILEDKLLSIRLNEDSEIETLKDRLDQLEGLLNVSDGREITYGTPIESFSLDKLFADARFEAMQNIISEQDKKINKLLDYLKLEYVDKVETNVIRRKK